MAKKTHFESDLGLLGSSLDHQMFFKNVALLVNRYYDQQSSCTILEKQMIKSSENLVAGRRTD